jgi:hypothetical protein
MRSENGAEILPPFTSVIRQALRNSPDARAAADLLFFEAWEMFPTQHLGATLRASQIRRANPELAVALERELRGARQAGRAA